MKNSIFMCKLYLYGYNGKCLKKLLTIKSDNVNLTWLSQRARKRTKRQQKRLKKLLTNKNDCVNLIWLSGETETSKRKQQKKIKKVVDKRMKLCYSDMAVAKTTTKNLDN